MIAVASLLDPQGYISCSTVLLMKKNNKVEFHDVDWREAGEWQAKYNTKICVQIWKQCVVTTSNENTHCLLGG